MTRFLERTAERVPDRPALIFGGGGPDAVTTCGELWGRAGRLATGLRAAGLEPGDRAILMIPMSPDLYATLIALLRMGAVAVFVDPWIGWRQIAAFAAFAEPRAFLGVGRSHLLRWLDRRLRSLPIAVTSGRRLGGWPAGRSLGEIEAAGGGAAGAPPVHPVATADPALITFTTGSSGLPKGANRTHGLLTSQHRALAAEFGYEPGDVDMPMFPVFALNNLAEGIPSVVPAIDFRHLERMDAGRVLAQMRRHRVTTATASPAFFDRLATRLERRPAERPALRRVLTGGAPVSDAQLRTWRRALPDTEILVVYGSTEAEPVAHLAAEERQAAASDRHPRAPGICAGRPTERLRTRLAPITRGPLVEQLARPEAVGVDGRNEDRNGKRAAAALGAGGEGPGEDHIGEGGIGELLVTGEHVCKDYYRNPAAVRENKLVDPGGEIWHRMGDTGYFDGGGRFWLVGRVHSTIFRAGQAVHPLLLEQAAAGDDPRIRRAAAVGVPDARLGERVVLVLETRGGDEVARAAAERLRAAGLLKADEIVCTPRELPLDPRHRSKVDYPRLRARLPRLRGSRLGGSRLEGAGS